MALVTYFYFKALNNFLKMQDQLPATSTSVDPELR